MSSEIKPTQSLDVRGEVCPYPDVMTQKKVEKYEARRDSRSSR
jgi:TusA-related sulfurtransferase